MLTKFRLKNFLLRLISGAMAAAMAVSVAAVAPVDAWAWTDTTVHEWLDDEYAWQEVEDVKYFDDYDSLVAQRFEDSRKAKDGEWVYVYDTEDADFSYQKTNPYYDKYGYENNSYTDTSLSGLHTSYILPDGNYRHVLYVKTWSMIETENERATAFQEIDEILDSLDLEDKSEYEICESIYLWICENIAYNHDDTFNHNDQYSLSYTLSNRSTRCAGFTCLFQEMALRAGLEVYYDRDRNHAWNEVVLCGQMYVVDSTIGSFATMDAEQDPTGYAMQVELAKSTMLYTRTAATENIKNLTESNVHYSIVTDTEWSDYDGHDTSDVAFVWNTDDPDSPTCEAYRACSKCGERFDDLGICDVKETTGCNTYRASITVDDHTYSSTREISTGNDHTWDSGEVAKAATCKKTGTMLYTCTTCGATKEEEISCLAHSYDTSNGETHYKALSDGIEDCTLGGYTIYTCSLCGEQKRKNNIEKAQAHDYDEPTISESSNTRTYTCQTCGYQLTLDGIHEWEDTDTEATCTSGSTTTCRCKICGEEETYTTSAALGHNYTTSSVTFTWNNLNQDFTDACNEPTCTYVATCTRCGEKVSGECYVTQTSYTDPTASKAGSRTFKATIEDVAEIYEYRDGTFYNDKIISTKKISLPKTGSSSTEETSGTKETDDVKANKITAKNVTASYSTKKQTVSLSAKATGGKLSYKSSSKKVTVSSSGKVTIAAKFSGTATITITAKDTTGTYQTVTKKIKVTVPKATSIKSVKNSASKKATVKWKKVSGVSGYQIQYATKKNFSGKKTVTASGVKKTSVKLAKLKKGKKIYVRVRTYKKVSGKKYYSAWSSTKSVKIKK